MSIIRTKFIQEIQEALNRPPLLIHQDFKILQQQKNSHVVLRVSYYLQQDNVLSFSPGNLLKG